MSFLLLFIFFFSFFFFSFSSLSPSLLPLCVLGGREGECICFFGFFVCCGERGLERRVSHIDKLFLEQRVELMACSFCSQCHAAESTQYRQKNSFVQGPLIFIQIGNHKLPFSMVKRPYVSLCKVISTTT